MTEKIQTGLVLEGGAMRGMFTSGILDCWMDHDVRVDGIMGVSAGAVFGCNLKSGQRGRAIRYNKKYCNDSRYVSFKNLVRSGDIYDAEFCYHELPYKLDVMDWETFCNDPAEFYVTCTDVETGEAVYHLCGEDEAEELEWFRASASMPLVSRVVEIGGKKLLDGGIADSIPLKAMEDLGYGRNIVILTQPEGFLKKPNEMLPVARVLLHKYPKLLQAMAIRHEVYNDTVAYVRRQEAAGKALILCPDEALGVSRTEKDPDKLQAIWELGYAKGEQTLEQVRTFLKQGKE